MKTCAIRYHPFQVCYDHTHGDAPNRPPANETFWVKSSSGSGNVSLDWKPRAGSGRAVVVNADDSCGVTAGPEVRRPLLTALVARRRLLGAAVMGVAAAALYFRARLAR